MQPERAAHPTEPIERIVLIGFMGAGKTTVGGLLAASLGWRFADSDHQVVTAQGASVAALFATYGERAFRAFEASAVTELLGRSHTVIGLGGGALELEATRTRLFATRATYVIFLETPLELALARCRHGQGPVRPLLADAGAVARRFEERSAAYRAAHLTLSTDGRSPEELVALARHALPPLAPPR